METGPNLPSKPPSPLLIHVENSQFFLLILLQEAAHLLWNEENISCEKLNYFGFGGGISWHDILGVKKQK